MPAMTTASGSALPILSPQAGEGRVGVGELNKMLTCFSPSFPIGAFSYSHGLEAAAERGAVRDRATLRDWIAAILAHGAGRMDADTLRDAHAAASVADIAALTAANRRGVAYRATAEMALETTAQGEAFLVSCRAAWP